MRNKYPVAVAALGFLAACDSADVDTDVVRQELATTLAPVADAYVRSGGYAAQNFGTAATLQADTNDKMTEKRIFLKFDLGAFSSITSAQLRLFVKEASGTAGVIKKVSSTSWSE